MASDYGRNFGFRRSDESYRISEGRFRTPKTGAVLLQGTCVEIDPASPGYLRVAAANAKPRPGICGMLVQEEFDRSIYGAEGFDSYDLNVTKRDRLSVITNGAGVKVWFKNTAAETRADGRAISAVTMVTGVNSLAVGELLGWNGTTWAEQADPDLAHFEVTEVNASTGYVEAVCLV